VLARAAPRDQNDDPPSTQAFKSYLYPDVAYPGLSSDPSIQRSYDNDWGSPRSPPTKRWVEYSGTVPYTVSYGPNTGCPPAITPLIVEKSRLLAAINALQPEYRGGTVTNEGMAWGWRVISPRWRGLWSGAPSNLPLAYGSANMDKVMVVLTDGDNQMLAFSYSGSLYSPYNAYETYKTFTTSTNATTATNATKAELDKRTQTVCTNIKQQGIILYTITFGAAPSSTAQTLMRTCATDTLHYFHSPDSTTLRTVFRSIGSQLTNLRIAQ
jgi:hypothetical protein